MFSRFILFKYKILICLVLLLTVCVIGYYLFKAENKFDIISIKEKLSSGNNSLFKVDIQWVEDNGKLIGTLKIDKLKSKSIYILQNHSIETISIVGKSQDFQDRIPCLNLVHLLSRSEVKKFYEIALKDSNSAIEGYEIPINNKVFIDYYQKETPEGLQLICKMYYGK